MTQRWPFRLHATYDETITRALNVYEAVNREMPFDGLHWFFDHCETISDRNIERIKALGGGIAVQDRMAFQGEYFVERYGTNRQPRTPPDPPDAGDGHPGGRGHGCHAGVELQSVCVPLLAGHRQDRRGTPLYPEQNRLDRLEALRLYTVGSAWFSSEEGKKGAMVPGQLADLAVLSADYFAIPDEQIKRLESVLTIVAARSSTPQTLSPRWHRRRCPVSPTGPQSHTTAATRHNAPTYQEGTNAEMGACPRGTLRPRAPLGARSRRGVASGLCVFCHLNMTDTRRNL